MWAAQSLPLLEFYPGGVRGGFSVDWVEYSMFRAQK